MEDVDMENESVIAKRDYFLQSLREIIANKAKNQIYLTEERRKFIVNKMQRDDVRDSEYHGMHKRYQLCEIDGKLRLIKRRKALDSPITYLATVEELYDILRKFHHSTKHGGRDRMSREIHAKYANVTKESISLFISLCDICNGQKCVKNPQHQIPKPNNLIHSREPKTLPILRFVSRGYVSFIDFSNCPDEGHHYVMVYQEQTRKLVHLRALRQLREDSVAWKLYKIFSQFDSPVILHLDRNEKFNENVLGLVRGHWPGCKLLRVVAKRETEPHEESAKMATAGENGWKSLMQEVADMIIAEMNANECRWLRFLPRIQMKLNCRPGTSSKSGKSAFEMVFGRPMDQVTANISRPNNLEEYYEDLEDKGEEENGDLVTPSDTWVNIPEQPFNIRTNETNEPIIIIKAEVVNSRQWDCG